LDLKMSLGGLSELKRMLDIGLQSYYLLQS